MQKRLINHRLFLSFFSIGLLLCCGKAYAQTFSLNTFNTYPLSTAEGTGSLDLIVKEAFRRIGAGASITRLSSERGLVNADRGIDDGDFVRIAGLEKTYPNLVRVREPLCRFEFTVFTRDPSIRIKGWKSLKPYNVGVITGWKILERKIVGTRSLTMVKNADALFELLENGRADLVVFDRVEGDALVRQKKLTGIRALRPFLTERDMYLYLNRRYAGLAPKLARALLDMKRDGAVRRIIKSVPDQGQ